MKIFTRLSLGFLALRELGPGQLGLYLLYRFGLRSGYFRWLSSGVRSQGPDLYQPLFDLPDPEQLKQLLSPAASRHLLAQADEIISGQVRLFGAGPQPLNLEPKLPLSHWTAYELGRAEWGVEDVKWIWEPARLGWAFTLGRAYHLTGQERFAEAFWSHLEAFWGANPPYTGPNWTSGQEVALRLLALVWSAQVFASALASTPERRERLLQSLAAHADRIPLTLIYARAQNNNHLLSEAAGLITAGRVLPQHPRAARWARLGWRWFNRGLQQQVALHGAYSQHSSNYLRLVLQLALWVWYLDRSAGSPRSASQRLQARTLERLAAATRWLLGLCDPESGALPNLGANDGAYILPLTSLPFSDYRPVLQSAGRAFLDEAPFPSGDWDEIGLWFGQTHSVQSDHDPHLRELIRHPGVLRSPDGQSWAYLRAVQFDSRPGHADQLHLDLWWRGLNLARDAGTYRYNAPPPWDNALTHTAVHNTVLVGDQEQMRRVGRFLYLSWAQAERLGPQAAPDGSWYSLAAQHTGYQRLGVVHRRQVTVMDTGSWRVEDWLQRVSAQNTVQQHLRLHWLLPDWLYRFEQAERAALLQLRSPYGWVSLQVGIAIEDEPRLGLFQPTLVKAGELLEGAGPVEPTWGWVSPTYGVKKPALSFGVTFQAQLPLRLVSVFQFSEYP